MSESQSSYWLWALFFAVTIAAVAVWAVPLVTWLMMEVIRFPSVDTPRLLA